MHLSIINTFLLSINLNILHYINADKARYQDDTKKYISTFKRIIQMFRMKNLIPRLPCHYKSTRKIIDLIGTGNIK